jgi:hypothetical protein
MSFSFEIQKRSDDLAGSGLSSDTAKSLKQDDGRNG